MSKLWYYLNLPRLITPWPHSEHSLLVYLLLPTHLNSAAISHFYESRHPLTTLRPKWMSKPPLFATPHHIGLGQVKSRTLEIITSRLYKSTLRLLSFNDTPPTHFTLILYALQTMQIFSLRWSCLNPISLYDLDTCSVYLALYMIWCTTDCQDGRYLLELSPRTSHSISGYPVINKSLICFLNHWSICRQKQVITDPHI